MATERYAAENGVVIMYWDGRITSYVRQSAGPQMVAVKPLLNMNLSSVQRRKLCARPVLLSVACMEVVAWLLVKLGWDVVTSLAVAPLLVIGYLFWPTLLRLALFGLGVTCSFLGSSWKGLADPRSYRLSNLRQYKLRSLFMVVTLAAALCWWFRPETDPAGAVIAAHAVLIENNLHDGKMVLYTSLDDSNVRRLRATLGTSNIIVRGIADAKQRVPRAPGPGYVDGSTGLPALEMWAKVDRIKPGQVTCQVGYGTGASCGIGSYLCKKRSGAWNAEELTFVHGD